MPDPTLVVSTSRGEWEVPEDIQAQASALSGAEFYRDPQSPGWQLVEQWVQAQPPMWIADMRHLATNRIEVERA